MKHVFVVGGGHSGTSLVLAMLGAHPRIYGIRVETRAFLKGRTDSEARQVIADHAADCDKPDATYLCEKTPRHIHHADRIATAFPGAKFVVCLRDPRDVACSLKRREGNLDDGISRWETDNRAALGLIGRNDCHVLRYEDLIADQASALERVCRFLDLDYDPAMLDYWRDDREWFGADGREDASGARGTEHKTRRNWQMHQPVMTDRIGVYQRELGEDEIARVTERLGAMAREFGYAL